MSADLMLIDKERKEFYEGSESEKCVFVDETSMGEPWHDFGKLFQDYEYHIIDDKLIKKVSAFYETLNHHEGCKIDEIIDWLKKHKGQALDFECW